MIHFLRLILLFFTLFLSLSAFTFSLMTFVGVLRSASSLKMKLVFYLVAFKELFCLSVDACLVLQRGATQYWMSPAAGLSDLLKFVLVAVDVNSSHAAGLTSV